MTKGLLFWVIMIIGFIYGLWSDWLAGGARGIGNRLVVFILLALLGWQVFGAAIK